MLVSCALTAPRSWRLFFVVFLVRMWRLNAWPRLTVPPGRTRKRFFALLLVFILGMLMLLMTCSCQAPRHPRPCLDGLQALGLPPQRLEKHHFGLEGARSNKAAQPGLPLGDPPRRLLSASAGGQPLNEANPPKP